MIKYYRCSTKGKASETLNNSKTLIQRRVMLKTKYNFDSKEEDITAKSSCYLELLSEKQALTMFFPKQLSHVNGIFLVFQGNLSKLVRIDGSWKFYER